MQYGAASAAMVDAYEKLRDRRPNQCCFITGDVREDWSYCTGERCVRHGRRTAYCDAHYAVVFVPLGKKASMMTYEEAA